MRRKIIIRSTLSLLGLIAITSCRPSPEATFATGIFEATETLVSAQQGGMLMRLDVSEGQLLSRGQEVGLVDTVPLHLQLAQAMATGETYAAQQPDIAVQTASLEQQIAKARQEVRRYSELVADGASPRKILDDAQSQLASLERTLAANRASLRTHRNTLVRQQQANDVACSQLRDQLRKCHITAPCSGTVIEKYAEVGEVTAPGKPLLKIADMKHLHLRAYVTSSQLAHIRVGQAVTVCSDYGDGQGRTYQGRVTWVSSQSEFTPKTILTDDERADLVYAVKIAVSNDGYIKNGMYGRMMLHT